MTGRKQNSIGDRVLLALVSVLRRVLLALASVPCARAAWCLLLRVRSPRSALVQV